MRRTVATVLLVLAVAGCSSSGGTGSPATSARNTTPAPSATGVAPAPTPTVTSDDTAAQLRKWGSLVARLEAPVQAAAAKIADCSSADYGVAAPTVCTLGRLTFSFTAETFGLKFKDEGDQLGRLPSEITDLVVSTQTDALSIDGLEKALSKKCGQQVTDRCLVALDAFDQGKDALMADFDGWKPYTH